ncbi:MAG: FISUMP domain-containing protein [Dysgonamonadaceae bacterium]|jgi:uncharacterized protein (TIGR02145 family)
MKKKPCFLIYPLLLIGIFLFILSCEKEDNDKITLKTPSVKTTIVSEITSTQIISGGTITSNGGAKISSRGVCWSTNQTPTIEDSKTKDGIGTGSYISKVTELIPETTYYIRAYATNSIGTSYGEQISFTTTKEISLPSITTIEATDVTEDSAVLGGDVTSDGNAPVTERGVVYSTSENPTVEDNKISANSAGTGDFSVSLSNLSKNTTYYVKAYAINSKGTAYGEQVSFITSKEVALPSVDTAEATDVTESSVTLGGEIKSDGNNPVTERGIVYSTTEKPTLENNKVSAKMDDSKSFTINLSGLKSNTKYYVRAYATNSVGTSYGNDISFVTQGSTFSDSRDGSVYKTVKIGDQEWMAENLKYLPVVHSNDEFESAGINKQPGYGVLGYNNSNVSIAKEQEKYKTYGALYNLYAVQNSSLCPKGWHMPTKEEWDKLVNFLGGFRVAGGKLKEAGTEHWVEPNEGATNESGFNALPGKFRNEKGVFFLESRSGMWWSSPYSNNPVKADVLILDHNNEGVSYTNDIQQEWGLSVRCLRD